jgi:hypothetical protein
MAKTLRRDIMEDKGTSTLRNRCLDLITNLRLEQPIQIESKGNSQKKPKETLDQRI